MFIDLGLDEETMELILKYEAFVYQLNLIMDIIEE